MKRVFPLFALILSVNLHAQTYIARPVLKIGDKIPSSLWSYLVNHTQQQTSYTDIKNKIIILDFWATYCAPCIDALPRLNELQQRYGNGLSIFIVNSQSKAGVDTMFKNRPTIRKIFDSLIVKSIYSDKFLHQLFPHQVVPHEVWIDKKGTIVGITSARYVTAKNVEQLIANNKIELPFKREDVSFNSENAILPNISRNNGSHPIYYSAVFNFFDGVWGGNYKYMIDSAKNTVRLSKWSVSLLDLYGEALTNFRCGDPFGSPVFDYGNRVIVEVNDSSRFFYPGEPFSTYEEWENQNKFCYESVRPLSRIDSVYFDMANDLNQYFNLDGRIEKRKMHCLALVKLHPGLSMKSTTSNKPASFFDADSVYHMVNCNLAIFRDVLSWKNRNYIFIDETGDSATMDLAIKAPLNNLPELRLELNNKYGLDLEEMVKEIDMIIITDKSKSTTLSIKNKINVN